MPGQQRIVDAHHHVWDLSVRDQDWITGDELAPLRRNFALADLEPEARAAGVCATVLVQTVTVADETPEFLALAHDSDLVAGVVGWCDLTAPDVADTLAALRELPGGDRLVGIRHQVQGEPDPGWLLRPDVLRGLRAVAAAGLVYDLVVQARQLPATVQAAALLPELAFVLDHMRQAARRRRGTAPLGRRRPGPGRPPQHRLQALRAGHRGRPAHLDRARPAPVRRHRPRRLRPRPADVRLGLARLAGSRRRTRRSSTRHAPSPTPSPRTNGPGCSPPRPSGSTASDRRPAEASGSLEPCPNCRKSKPCGSSSTTTWSARRSTASCRSTSASSRRTTHRCPPCTAPRSPASPGTASSWTSAPDRCT